MRKRFGLLALITALLALGLPAGASANHLSPGDFKNVSKFCKALRTEMGDAAFAQAFGTNHNKRNAFGKCVSKRGVLPEPPATPVTPCQPAEPPLPVSAFALDPCLVGVEPPLPVSAFGATPAGTDSDAKHAGKHGPKSK
jgi:hypothetical protein